MSRQRQILKSVTIDSGVGSNPVGRFIRIIAIAISLLPALAACTTTTRDAGRPALAIPAGIPERLLAEERANLVQNFGGEYRASNALRVMVRTVVDRVVAASDDPGQIYRVTILNSPSPNAFALPNGELYITRGLLALANDSSELAAVVAHEVAHVTANHALKRAELERIARNTPSTANGDQNDDADAMKFLQASFSRAQELEADDIGIRTIAKAGYDPYGAARFLASLARQVNFQSLSQGQGRYSFLSSHPATPQRIAAALVTARDNTSPKSTETNRADYLRALEGMAFGEDPAGGVIRDHRFLHPRFDFTITAPAALQLVNSSDAVLGLNQGGSVAMRIDIVRTDLNPVDSLATGWIEGVKIGAVDHFDINGLDAATTQGSGTDWTFRFSAIRKGQDLYRIIFAARAITPELDRMFLDSIRSFRALTNEERDSLTPVHLSIVEAHTNDTIETIVNQMRGIDRPLDRFLVLNGLDRPKIKEGELYKSVQPD